MNAIASAWLLAWWLLPLSAPPVRGLILSGSGDPAANTHPPTGLLASGGWQWQGRWLFALETVVGPRHFVTAHHLGGRAGDVFEFRGLRYLAQEVTQRAGTDLDIVTVAGRFADFAPLQAAAREGGRPLLVFGRGGRRGDPEPGRGWWVGEYDGVQRWGTNTVAGWVPADRSPVGELLVIDFSVSAGADEAMYAGGDSGSGAFVLDRDGVWRLAGIGFSVEGPYAPDTASPVRSGALYDTRGLWAGFPGSQELLPPGPSPTGTLGYMTGISAHAAWLGLQTSAAPPSGRRILESAPDLRAAFTEESAYAVDDAARRVEAPVPGPTSRFYRLRGASRLEFTSVDGGLCRFRFDP